MEELSVEIVHYFVFRFLDAKDVLAFALTSKAMYRTILGEPGEENEYDMAQFRALGGVGLCARNGWWRAACLAVKRGYGDPTERWMDGFGKPCPLEMGIRGESTTLVSALLAHPDVTMGHRHVAAFVAVAKVGNQEMVRLLLEDGRIPPQEMRNEALKSACWNGHANIVSLLLEDGRADPGAGNSRALVSAVRSGNVEIIRMLLEDGRSDPLVRNQFPLRMAAKCGWPGIVRLLLADPRMEGVAVDPEVVAVAAEYEHGEVVELLKAHRAP